MYEATALTFLFLLAFLHVMSGLRAEGTRGITASLLLISFALKVDHKNKVGRKDL